MTRYIRSMKASEVQRERVEWCLPGLVPYGSVTVLVGDGGLGKSTWSCLLAGQISNGAGDVLIASAEDSLAATWRPRLEAVEADLDRVHFVSMQNDDGDEDGLIVPDDMLALEELVTGTGARLVVIDPLTAHLSSSLNSWSDHSVRRALAPLHRLAETTHCAVLPILHLNKVGSSDPLKRINGSVAFDNAARSVLVFARDPEDGADGNRRILAHAKCNVAPLAPSLAYVIEPILLPGRDNDPEVETSKLQPLGESHHLSGDLLGCRESEDGQSSALDEATDFLEQELAAGPVPAKTIYACAANAGVTKITLRRAAKALKVQKNKSGFDGAWDWSLPAQTEGAHASTANGHDDHLDHLAINEGLRGHDGVERSQGDHARDNGHLVDDDELARLRRKLPPGH